MSSPPTLTLEALVQGTDVHVTRSATDPSLGSGLDAGTCLLEVREDEEAWQTFSTDCGGEDATHDGQPGHTYTFRLSASDNVGNADSFEVQAVVPYVTPCFCAKLPIFNSLSLIMCARNRSFQALLTLSRKLASSVGSWQAQSRVKTPLTVTIYMEHELILRIFAQN